MMFVVRLPLCFVGPVSRVELYSYMHSYYSFFDPWSQCPKTGKGHSKTFDTIAN
jgi:hypothetical protein